MCDELELWKSEIEYLNNPLHKDKHHYVHGCNQWHWVNRENGQIHIWHCNTGRCDNIWCRIRWASARIALVSNLIKEHELWRFFTLTISQDCPLKEAWCSIPHTWLKMRKRLARICKKRKFAFKFVAVLECHQSGYPHIHGFTNLWLDVHEWSKLWLECGGGKIVYLEQVKSETDISRYVNKTLEVGKYVGKDNLINALDYIKPRQRSLWRSRIKTQLEIKNTKENVDTKWILRKRNDAHDAQQQGRISKSILEKNTPQRDAKSDDRFSPRRWRTTIQENNRIAETQEITNKRQNQKTKRRVNNAPP